MEQQPNTSKQQQVLLTRRRFLALAVVGVGGAAAAIIAVDPLRDLLLSAPRQIYSEITTAELPASPPGPISANVVDVLLATTQAIIGVPIEDMSHYQRYFQWRAKNLDGYKQLYEMYSEQANQASEDICGHSFVNCDLDSQRNILEEEFLAFSKLSELSRLEKARIGVQDGHKFAFVNYIFIEAFKLFARTDAWVLSGYVTWPGIPQGLEEYQTKGL